MPVSLLSLLSVSIKHQIFSFRPHFSFVTDLRTGGQTSIYHSPSISLWTDIWPETPIGRKCPQDALCCLSQPLDRGNRPRPSPNKAFLMDVDDSSVGKVNDILATYIELMMNFRFSRYFIQVPV